MFAELWSHVQFDPMKGKFNALKKKKVFSCSVSKKVKKNPFLLKILRAVAKL